MFQSHDFPRSFRGFSMIFPPASWTFPPLGGNKSQGNQSRGKEAHTQPGPYIDHISIPPPGKKTPPMILVPFNVEFPY